MTCNFEVNVPYMEPNAIGAQRMFGFPASEFFSYIQYHEKTLLAIQAIMEDKFMVTIPGYVEKTFMEGIRRQNEYMKIRSKADLIQNDLVREIFMDNEIERMGKEMSSGFESLETDLTHYVPNKVPVLFVEEHNINEIMETVYNYGFRGQCAFLQPRMLNCKVE